MRSRMISPVVDVVVMGRSGFLLYLLVLCFNPNSSIVCRAELTSIETTATTVTTTTTTKTSTLPPIVLRSSMDNIENSLKERDEALHLMKYNVGNGDEMMYAYIEPSLEQMYQYTHPVPSTTKVVPKFNGHAGKFINMSNKPVWLYWYVRGYMCDLV
jgi:hypothetical protein